MNGDQQYIQWLEQCTNQSAPEVGNKLAGIGQMLHLGLRAPPGFAVTRRAYEAFLAHTGVGHQIQKRLAEVGADPHMIHHAAAEVRWLIEATPLPDGIAAQVAAAYGDLARLCGGRAVQVAVRSSATAEDMPDASFAGQQDTYLGVLGEQDVLRSLRRCWASLFTERAVSYRAKMNYGVAGVSIAVGVQKMVDARAAGVLFTINPVNGNPFEIVIEGNWGLGESVVQGMVTPDRFVVRKQDLSLIREEISHKTVQVVQGPGGAQTVAVPPERQSIPCLDRDEVLELARLGRQMEAQFGEPRDLEWAVDGDLPFPDRVVLLQMRPVTTTGLRGWQREPGKSSTDHIIDLMLKKRFGR